MANVTGTGAGGGKPKKPVVKKKKYVAPKAVKPAAKPASKTLPGYKVPKKLTKDTRSNRNAARPSLAAVMKASEKSIAAFNAANMKATKSASIPKGMTENQYLTKAGNSFASKWNAYWKNK